MTGWNEDNFLERLMAQVRQERGAERGPCPDAETLCAVLEGEAPAPLREQVTEHLRHCPDCADLQNRLLNFDAGTSPEPEAVWKETRKRLDNWLEGFLRSQAANLRAAKSTVPSRKGLRWETFWSPFLSWKVVWGLGVAALLVLIADGVLVMELRRGQPPQVQVAARPAVPQRQPANLQPPEKPVEKSHPQGRIEKRLKAPQEHLVGAPLVGALPQVAERLPSKPQPPYGQGSGGPGGPVAATSSPSPEVRNLPSLTAQAAVQPPPRAATEVAAAPKPAPGVRRAGPGRTLASVRAAGSMRPPSSPAVNAAAAVPAQAAPSPEANAAAPAATEPPPPPAANAAAAVPTEPPPSLRLEPGAHLLIALSSVKPLPNGAFQFRGTLLLPVVHPGPVPLDRGAEVIGAGTMSQGQTSLAVTEFVIEGVRYTLKSGSGAMKAQTPGAGGAVQFDRSQVLEMWPASPSVYEKAPDTAAPPEPQK